MRSNVCQPLYISCRGMDYRTGRPGPGAHELRGPLSQSLYVKSLCSSYLWLKKLYFVNFLMALIECTCAVLENVHVCQGRNYRQCSQHGRFVGKADSAFLLYSDIGMSNCRSVSVRVI